MQIQNVCDPMLSKDNSTRGKRNQPNFSGNLYFMELGLESLTKHTVVKKSLEYVAELIKFKKQIKILTYPELDVFIWEMPKEEANKVKVRRFHKPSVEKMENYKIMYHDNKKHTVKISGIYLEPNENSKRNITKKNNDKLFNNLLVNALDSMDDFINNLEVLLRKSK